MRTKDINIILENTISNEIKKAILQETKDYYHVMDGNLPIETFESYDEAKKYIDKQTGKELIIDKKKYGSYDEMIDTLDEMSEEINENKSINKMKRKLKEGMYQFDDTSMDENWDESEMSEMSPHERFTSGQSNYDEMTEEDVDYQPNKSSDKYVETLYDKYLNDEPDEDLSEEGMCMECGDKSMEEEDDIQMEDVMDYDSSGKSYSDYVGSGPSSDEEEWFNETYDVIIKQLGREPTWHEAHKIGGTLDMAYNNEKQPEEAAHMVLSKYFDTNVDDSESPEDLDETYDEGYMYEEKDMCMECGSMLNEEGMCMECSGSMRESKKRKIRLRESELVNLIKKMVNETIPGLTMANKSKEGSKKDSTKHYGEVDAKMKKYLKFEGNDNPEFPNQINKGEKVARKNTDKQESEMRKNFAGLENLEYDIEPSENFKKRLKMAIEGHPHMGNAMETPKPSIKPTNDAPKGKEAKEKSGNTVKTDTAKKIDKQVKDRKEDKQKRVIYKKEKVPVDTAKKDDKSLKETKVPNNVIDEIKKMKKLSLYNKRTQ